MGARVMPPGQRPGSAGEENRGLTGSCAGGPVHPPPTAQSSLRQGVTIPPPGGLPHPCLPVPFPDQPRITPFADLCLPGSVDRLPLPADVAPAELDLRPEKLLGREHPRERSHRRPLCLPEAVVAEVEPFPPLQRRRRPAAADVAGFVLLDRKGDVDSGVDGSVTAGDSRATAGAVTQRRHGWPNFVIWALVCDLLPVGDSNLRDAATQRSIVHALRPLTLLYIYVLRSIHIGILVTVS